MASLGRGRTFSVPSRIREIIAKGSGTAGSLITGDIENPRDHCQRILARDGGRDGGSGVGGGGAGGANWQLLLRRVARISPWTALFLMTMAVALHVSVPAEGTGIPQQAVLQHSAFVVMAFFVGANLMLCSMLAEPGIRPGQCR